MTATHIEHHGLALAYFKLQRSKRGVALDAAAKLIADTAGISRAELARLLDEARTAPPDANDWPVALLMIDGRAKRAQSLDGVIRALGGLRNRDATEATA